ncbi:MAG: ATP-binding protein, partial [Verrucomicrobiota bacterium]
LLEQELEGNPIWKGHAKEIHRAAESAATLTRQLLAFSRRQILEKEVSDLNTVIEDSRNMVDRLLGESVALEMHLSDEPLYGMVDRGQIQQVLMNLCINARDAMSGGGTIKVSTEVLQPGSAHLKFVNSMNHSTGWACLAVQDTGSGMSEETASRIFEPFYSTKGSNGTGLGLSVVHGIVSQHDGVIRLESVLGKGTVFYLYFPLQDSKPVSVSAPSNIATIDTAGHGERILVVEDEPQVQRFVSQALTSRGYSVEVAEDLDPAREMLDGARGFKPFDLILCDCVLPSGNGVDFLVQELQVHPETRAILTTGYTDRESLMQAAEDYDLGFLQKPYSLDRLFETVRRALDGRLAEAV